MISQTEQAVERMMTLDNNDHLRELVGELGTNLKLVERAFGVDIHQRGCSLSVQGHGVDGDGQCEVARRVLVELAGLIAGGHVIHPSDVLHAIRILRSDPEGDLKSFFKDVVLIGVNNRPVIARSAGQRRYLATLRTREVAFGVGPAGTGKTYLAVAVAVAALKRGAVRRIVLTRPAVEAGEKLGFLPGDLTEKVDPYLRPLYDALQDMLPAERVARMMERRVIEVAPLAFMRGRTLDHAYVLLDEAQNTTAAQMKMFLTRLGEGSRMVITGDVTQVDLPRHAQSGMARALHVLQEVSSVGFCHLTSEDVVRHPLVAEIIDAYARADASAGRR